MLFLESQEEPQRVPWSAFSGSPDYCLHSHICMEPSSPKAQISLLNLPNVPQSSQDIRKFSPRNGMQQNSVSSISSLLSMVSMRNMLTFPTSSFRWSRNNCTGWNNYWNHSCSWNPCRNNNRCCKEDVRQVLVSKLLIRLFKQALSSEQGHRNHSGNFEYFYFDKITYLHVTRCLSIQQELPM